MEIAVKSVVILFLLLGMIMICFTFGQVMYTLNVIQDTAQEAILSQVAINAPACFAGYRESSGTARYFDETAWHYAVDDSEAVNYINSTFQLNQEGTRVNGDVRQFTIRNFKTDYVNTEGSKVKFSSTFLVELPIFFMGTDLGIIKKEMKVMALYDTRY